MGAGAVFGGVGDVVPERLGEELVRGGEVLLAVAEQHAGPVVEGGPGRLGHQRGLAETGLARDEHDLASFAAGHALYGIGDRLHLGLPPDHAHPGRTARRPEAGSGRRRRLRPSGSQSTSTVSTGRADPSGSARRASGIRDGCAGRPSVAHDVRGQDLAASHTGRRVGPPRRPDPRSSRRPRWLTSPPLSPTRRPTVCSRTAVVLFDALLHGHCARQCGRGRGEHHHEPVTEVLHLGAAGLGDGLAQDREVAPADLVGRPRARGAATTRSSPRRR